MSRVAWERALTAVVVAVGLVPIWAGPVFPTTDGPSHLYNAWVAHTLDSDPASELAEHFEVDRGPRPQFVSAFTLERLGAIIGWEPSERVLATLILLAGLFAVTRLARARDPASIALLLWIPSGWFLWMGFYDFSLSICFFALLAIGVERDRFVLVVLGMVGLIATHLFAAAVAALLLLWAWIPRKELGLIGTAFALAAMVTALLAGAGATDGTLEWSDPLSARRALALVFMDPVVSVSAAGLLVGLLFSGVALMGALRVRSSERAAPGSRTPVGSLAALGALLLVGSLVAPDWIGSGGYVGQRLRILGLLLLLPAGIAGARERWGPRVWAAVGATSFAISLVQTGLLLGISARMEERLTDLDQAFAEAGAGEGTRIASAIGEPFGASYRAFLYLHLPERLAIGHRWIVVDNYEASQRVFPVRWRKGEAPLVLEWIEGEARIGGEWRGAVYLVHEADTPIRSEADITARYEAGRYRISVLEGTGASGAGRAHLPEAR